MVHPVEVASAVNTIAAPDAPPVADAMYTPPTVAAGGVDTKVTTCVPGPTAKLCWAVVAAVSSSPANAASTTHVPTPTSMTVPSPATVQPVDIGSAVKTAGWSAIAP